MRLGVTGAACSRASPARFGQVGEVVEGSFASAEAHEHEQVHLGVSGMTAHGFDDDHGGVRVGAGGEDLLSVLVSQSWRMSQSR